MSVHGTMHALPARPARLEEGVLTGAGVLDHLGAALDELHAATATPVTARRLWLSTWVACHPEYTPLAVIVRQGSALEAAALLGLRRGHGLDELVALGHGPSDLARLPARTAEAAARLARAMVAHLSERGGWWKLIMRHLPSADLVAQQVAHGLRHSRLIVGDVSPALNIGPDRALRAYVSRNHHQQVRRLMNRMERDGLDPRIEHFRTESEIRALLPEVEDVCRQRDLDLRGRTALERPGSGAFFRSVILEHAARGQVELTTVRLVGQLAAYVLCFLDGDAYRMWSCRMAPAWARYGPGRVGNDAALRRALADPACACFDWMRGEESYKASVSNDLEGSEDLLAWSSPAVQAVLDLPRRVHRRAKQVVARHTWLLPAVRATRRAQATGRRNWRSLRRALRGRPR